MYLLGQAIDVPANTRTLVVRHRGFVTLMLVTAVLDVVSTIAFMSTVGIGRETNWIIRTTSIHLGIYLGPIVGKLFQLMGALGLGVMAPRLARFVLAVVILVNLIAFVLNMFTFTLG